MKKNRIIPIVVLAVIIFIILIIIILLKGRKDLTNNNLAELSKEEQTSYMIDEEKNMTERDRIDYYFKKFLDYTESGDYAQAYSLLGDDFKRNYFPSLEEFQTYMIEYFPKSSLLDFTNIERLGNMYVLWIDVEDYINGKRGKNFKMNGVVEEYGYNDFKVAFSVNSAKEASNN